MTLFPPGAFSEREPWGRPQGTRCTATIWMRPPVPGRRPNRGAGRPAPGGVHRRPPPAPPGRSCRPHRVPPPRPAGGREAGRRRSRTTPSATSRPPAAPPPRPRATRVHLEVVEVEAEVPRKVEAGHGAEGAAFLLAPDVEVHGEGQALAAASGGAPRPRRGGRRRPTAGAGTPAPPAGGRSRAVSYQEVRADQAVVTTAGRLPRALGLPLAPREPGRRLT
jgi:hypothetical protein